MLLMYPSPQTHYCSTSIQLQFFNNCSKYQYLRYKYHGSICKTDRKFTKKLWSVRSFWSGMEQHLPVRSICVQECLSLWVTPGAHPADSAPSPLSWEQSTQGCRQGFNTQQSMHNNTQWGRKHVFEVMPSKRVMGLSWCPQCWGWESSFWLVQWYCSSWTTCLHSPLSQSCPYTTHPSSSGLLSRPFRGCSCAPSTAVLVNQALLPRKLPEPCTAKRDCPSWKNPQCHVHSSCTQKLPRDLKADSPHQQQDFVLDIVSFQQSHILSLSEQFLPILATHFRRQIHTWFSCAVW